MDHSVFDHVGPWTEAAYLALPHDGRVEVVDGTLLVGPAAGEQRVRVIERVREAVAAALPEGLRVRGPVPLRLGPDCLLMPDLVVTAAPAGGHDASADDDADGDPAGTDADGGDADGGDADGGDADGGDADGGDAAVRGESETAGSEAGSERASDGGDSEILDAAAALMVIEVVGCDHGATDRTFKPQLYARSRIPYSLLIDHDGPFAVADMIIGGRYHEYAHAAGDERFRIEEPFPLDLDLAATTAVEPARDRTEMLPQAAAEAS